MTYQALLNLVTYLISLTLSHAVLATLAFCFSPPSPSLLSLCPSLPPFPSLFLPWNQCSLILPYSLCTFCSLFLEGFPSTSSQSWLVCDILNSDSELTYLLFLGPFLIIQSRKFLLP